MSDERDPLLYGPSAPGSSGPKPTPPPLPPPSGNWADRAPWLDALELLARPQTFFRSIPGVAKEPKLFLKALLVFVLFSWIAGGVQSAFFNPGDWISSLEDLSIQLGESGLPGQYSIYLQRLPFGELKHAVSGFGAMLSAMATLASPFIALFWILLNSLVGTWWLKRLVPDGVRVDMGSVFLSQVYANWFVLLGILPFFGGFVGALVVFLYSIFSLVWMYDTTFSRAVLAIRFIELAFFLMAMLFVAMGVAIFALMF